MLPEPELPVDVVALIGPGGILEGVSICPTSDEGGWIETSGIDNLLVSTRNGGAIKVPSSDSSDNAASGTFAWSTFCGGGSFESFVLLLTRLETGESARTGGGLEESVRMLPAADSVLLNEIASHEVLFDSARGSNEIRSS